MLIKYRSVIINGVDKSGKVEDVPTEKAQRLIHQGYAVSEVKVFSTEQGWPPETTRISAGQPKTKPKRKKR